MSIPTLQSVLAQGQLIAPDTFDGISTRAAEHMGCKGALPVSYTHLDVYKRQGCNSD